MNAAGDHAQRRDSDHKVLAFLAAHRLVLATHIQALLEVDNQVAHEQLEALEGRRLVRRSRVIAEHAVYYQITHLGLAVIASDLPPPRLHLDRCRHDLGIAWIWLAAVRGTFGQVDRVLTEREQRAHDAAPAGSPSVGEHGEPPFGVRAAPGGARNPAAPHYPDLMFIGNKEGRIPVELILTPNGQRQLQTLMTSYGADPNIAAILYFADTPAVRNTIQQTATELGIADRIYIRAVDTPKDATPPTPQ